MTLSGFNLGTNYGSSKIINIYMTEKYSMDDVKSIVNETLGEKYEIGYTDEFEDTISVKVKEASNEQISNLKTKIREKYNIEDDVESIMIINSSNIRILDIVKEYIKPILITFVLVIIYYAVAFRKLGIMKSFVSPILEVVGVGDVYVSILAIARVPINEIIIPVRNVYIYYNIIGNYNLLKE